MIQLSPYIESFINYDDFTQLNEIEQIKFLEKVNADCIIHVFPRKDIAKAAKRAGIKTRVGTSHRLYHLATCNRLVHFTRKNSDLHEAQLNLKLLKGLNIPTDFSLNELAGLYNLQNVTGLPARVSELLNAQKINLVIHPRSHGSAREWGLENFRKLIYILNERVNIFITGSVKEKEELKEWMTSLPNGIHDLTGALSLIELISLLNSCDGIVAGSTGPLHIAAALGRHALGIYPPIRPMHAGRWAPVGINAQFVTVEKKCTDCKTNPADCKCLQQISPDQVAALILQWNSNEHGNNA